LGLDLLREVVEIALADGLAQQCPGFIGQCNYLLIREEYFAVPRIEGHQALDRREATHSSTLAERT
jgi:hypothetical protein